MENMIAKKDWIMPPGGKGGWGYMMEYKALHGNNW